MPELPEVETVVRTLRPGLQNARLEGVWWSGLPLRMLRAPDVPAMKRVCRGTRVLAVRRQAKYILIDVGADPEHPRGTLLVHLGMSGQLRLAAEQVPRAPHTHLVWRLGDGHELRFVDPRRFGWVAVVRAPATFAELATLGPDPLTELHPADLAAALATSRAPIKAFLLDQRRVAGLGNIYVSEALHRAGVHPGTPARRVRGRAPVLVEAIKAALLQGIANRGTTLRDYRDADGAAGNNAAALLVYGRSGAPCGRCGAAIKRRVDAGRSTYFCGACQRR
jgi:formamidopyrimidine-DNA glycosylase